MARGGACETVRTRAALLGFPRRPVLRWAEFPRPLVRSVEAANSRVGRAKRAPPESSSVVLLVGLAPLGPPYEFAHLDRKLLLRPAAACIPLRQRHLRRHRLLRRLCRDIPDGKGGILAAEDVRPVISSLIALRTQTLLRRMARSATRTQKRRRRGDEPLGGALSCTGERTERPASGKNRRPCREPRLCRCTASRP